LEEIEQRSSAMVAVSNAMVRLHKEQFGRGPTKARSYYAGPDTLLSILENVLVPAEQKLIEIGQEERVRDTRTSFQAATQGEFIAAVEQIVHRKVCAFASAVDVKADLAYEIFTFERSKENGEAGSSEPMPAAAVDGSSPQS
jgi:uncharacterized protein YbcI